MVAGLMTGWLAGCCIDRKAWNVCNEAELKVRFEIKDCCLDGYGSGISQSSFSPSSPGFYFQHSQHFYDVILDVAEIY